MNDAAGERAPRPWILGLLVFTLAIVPFVPAIGGPFIYDDRPLIAGNAVVHDFGHWRAWIGSHLWDTTFGGDALDTPSARYWRPAVLASYALDWKVGGGQPVVFHFTNLFLHGVVAVLVYRWLLRWLLLPWWAFGLALVFAVHPAKTESVAWISGRPDLLCALGVMLALEGAELARRSSSRASSRASSQGLLLELVGTGLAYASKEAAVVLPFMLMAEQWRRSPPAGTSAVRWMARAAGGQLVIAALYTSWRVFLYPVHPNPPPVPLTDHGALVFESLGRYFELLLVPYNLGLGRSVVGAEPGHPFAATPAFVVLGLLGCLGLVAGAWLALRRLPALSVALLLLLVLLAPVANLSLMPSLVLASPRFLYLPSLAAILALGVGLVVGGRQRVPSWALAALAVTVVASGSAAALRSGDYSSEYRFWAYEAAASPRDVHPYQYFAAVEVREGRPRAALRIAVHGLSSGLPDQLRFGPELDLVISAILALGNQTPDSDGATLRGIADFSRAVAENRTARLDVPHRGVHFVLRPRSARPFQFMLLEATALSRLGDDLRTAELLERLINRCAGCEELYEGALMPAGRAGRLDLLARLLDRLPAQHRARTAMLPKYQAAVALRAEPSFADTPPLVSQYFALFGAWGRAYHAAGPALAQAERLEPGERRVLGELAFRAGDERAARGLLGSLGSTDAFDAFFVRWRAEMGWVDA
ncbi:MAG TPA: hypothetical protein VLC09_09110, partial [Polyangiaceae bacterium]|nr:hypothetical protein [Polyangiaceae bacterium]